MVQSYFGVTGMSASARSTLAMASVAIAFCISGLIPASPTFFFYRPIHGAYLFRNSVLGNADQRGSVAALSVFVYSSPAFVGWVLCWLKIHMNKHSQKTAQLCGR